MVKSPGKKYGIHPQAKQNEMNNILYLISKYLIVITF